MNNQEEPVDQFWNDVDVSVFEPALLKEQCKEFKEFVREFWDEVPGTEPLLWNWHIDFECEELQRIARRVHARMPKKHDAVFNVPFGTSKSTVISILYQAWVWTFFPEARFISATHTQSLAHDLAGKFHSVVASERYQECWKIEFTSESAAHLKNTKGGERLTCTVGGKTPTGFHAHLVIVDDPLDPQGARSEADLDNARRFMTEVIPSRVVDKDVSVIILVMQRLHYRDPTAVMIEMSEGEDATPLLRVCLPGEVIEQDDVVPNLETLRRRASLGNWTNHEGVSVVPYQDGLLDPRRLNRVVLNRYRKRMGAYSYAGQVLQKPTPPGGGMFKMTYFSKRVKAAPYHGKRIRYWDRACLTAGTMVATNRGQIPIQDVIAGDFVLTRTGAKKVLRSWMTKTVNASELCAVHFKGNGSILIGTKDHLVWTDNRGWAELGTLKEEDQACLLGSFVFGDFASENGAIDFYCEDETAVPVYDLTVEDDHEFFANGVLVHNSTEDGGCYTAGVLMSLAPNGNFYVEHVVHGQWEPVERNEIILATALKDRSRYGPNHEPLIVIEAEGGSTGIESYRRLVSQLAGFRVKEDRPTGSKDVRAEPWSAQCAAGNVYLVDNGQSKGLGKADWDVEGYVQEHCHFRPEVGKRLGKFKDQVDASSGGFNLLCPAGNRGATAVTYGVPSGPKGGLRIVVVSRDDLMSTVTDHKCLLVTIQDPIPKGENDGREIPLGASRSENGNTQSQVLEGASGRQDSQRDQDYGNGDGLERILESSHGRGNSGTVGPANPVDDDSGEDEGPKAQVVGHGLNKLIDSMVIEFCDFMPSEYQEKWDESIPPWNLSAEKLVMNRDQGKRLWTFLRRQRGEKHEVIVFQDDGDRRALSVAYAVCDVLRLPRTVIYVVNREDMNTKGQAPNSHVYDTVRMARGLVI